MLGTPNRGSFAPALALTGVEKLVQAPRPDRRRARAPRLLGILATFGGLYQMLPSPLVDLGDDHMRPVRGGAVAAARCTKRCSTRRSSSRSTSHEVVDPERLVYVAGCRPGDPGAGHGRTAASSATSSPATATGGCRTRSGCSTASPPTTSTRTTATSPRTARVLDAIHDLLATGRSTTLSPSPVASIDGRGSVDARRDRPARRGRRGRRRSPPAAAAATPTFTDRDRIRLATLTTEDYLGAATTAGARPGVTSESQDEPDKIDVEVDVVWGDVTKVARRPVQRRPLPRRRAPAGRAGAGRRHLEAAGSRRRARHDRRDHRRPDPPQRDPRPTSVTSRTSRGPMPSTPAGRGRCRDGFARDVRCR